MKPYIFSLYYATNTTHVHIVEKREILSHRKIFREINSLVISVLVKPLLSRNFCQNSVRGNIHDSQCGKMLKNAITQKKKIP